MFGRRLRRRERSKRRNSSKRASRSAQSLRFTIASHSIFKSTTSPPKRNRGKRLNEAWERAYLLKLSEMKIRRPCRFKCKVLTAICFDRYIFSVNNTGRRRSVRTLRHADQFQWTGSPPQLEIRSIQSNFFQHQRLGFEP